MFSAPETRMRNRTTSDPEWRPSGSARSFQERAGLLSRLREFFAERGVLEVQTPVLCTFPNLDMHIEPIAVAAGEMPGQNFPPGGGGGQRRYLRTSPEPALKRLLAHGLGSIYEIGPVFRSGETGLLHNLEFTLVEWYRVGFDHIALMDEVEALVRGCVESFEARRITFREAFQRWARLDPEEATRAEIEGRASDYGLQGGDLDRESLLDGLMTLAVEPGMAADYPHCGVFVHSYPASQAGMARLLPDDLGHAARFELFLGGIEVANGYWELDDPVEQRRRFEAENRRRTDRGMPALSNDVRLLAALDAGLPGCAGVAMGLERLHMWLHRHPRISEVLAFPGERA